MIFKKVNGKILAQMTCFLKKSNIWEKYCIEFKRQNKKSIYDELVDRDASEAIDMSFVFTKTKDGYYYWQNVSIEWRKYLEE